jgi:hypothetical protein
MKAYAFEKYVARLVEKVAHEKLEVVDPDHNVLVYHDEGMTEGEQITCANLAAAEVLFETGFLGDLDLYPMEMA